MNWHEQKREIWNLFQISHTLTIKDEWSKYLDAIRFLFASIQCFVPCVYFIISN